MEIKVLDKKNQKLLQGTLTIGNVSDIVKEFIQNAIDAKAKEIKITLKLDVEGNCLNVICQDNGTGITLCDMGVIGKRYYTSKSSNQPEILGYRGQALNSIISISAICIVTSKTADGSNINRLMLSRGQQGKISRSITTDKPNDFIDKGKCSLISSVGHGTRMYAYDVFGTIPVRKKQIFNHDVNQTNRNLHKIYSQIRRVALDCCIWDSSVTLQVEIEEKHSKKMLIHVSGNSILGDLKHSINAFKEIYGASTLREFSIIKKTKGDVAIEMAIGPTRVNSKWNRVLYLNRRPMTEGVIWNNFLSKIQNKRYNERFEFIVLIKCNEINSGMLKFVGENHLRTEDRKQILSLVEAVLEEYFLERNYTSACLHSTREPYDMKQVQKLPEGRLFAKSRYFSEIGTLKINKFKVIQNLNVVNQVDRKFILCRIANQNGEYLVAFDQHACQERINLEKIYRQAFGMEFRQQLDNPIKIQLNEEEKDELNDFRETLEFWGIKMMNDDYECVIKELPQFVVKSMNTSGLTCEKIESEICQFMEDLSSGKKNEIKSTGTSRDWLTLIGQMPDLWCDILKKRSCRMSTKFGERMTKSECQILVAQLFECQDPFHCAHGRTTMYPLCRL